MPQRPCQPAAGARRPASAVSGILSAYLHTADTSMRLRVLSERKYGYADTSRRQVSACTRSMRVPGYYHPYSPVLVPQAFAGARPALTTCGCGPRAAGCVSIDAADAALLHTRCTRYGTHEQSMPVRDLPVPRPVRLRYCATQHRGHAP